MANRRETCEDCGKTFTSGKKRSWGYYCAPCAEKRRREGRGPFQLPKLEIAGPGVASAPSGQRSAAAVKYTSRYQEHSSMAESEIRLSVDEFIKQVPTWHAKYLHDNPCVPKIEERIQQKKHQAGYLDKADIKDIVLWGSKKRGPFLWSRIDRHNSDDEIRHHTAEAIKALPDSRKALEQITRIFGLGVSFGSKVVAFLCPESAPVLDRVVRDCLSKADNWTGRYDYFVALCKHIAKRQQEGSGPREGGVWYLRDIEMALFQFAWREKGKAQTYITGALPLDPSPH